jgi:hypothetical protein
MAADVAFSNVLVHRGRDFTAEAPGKRLKVGKSKVENRRGRIASGGRR